jgi:hypothetical protein
MKTQSLFTVCAAAALFAACASTPDQGTVGFRETPVEECVDVSTPILAGQHTDAGEVVVSNDGDNLLVSATSDSAEGWYFKEIHVYAGTDPVPVNNGGNPAPGQFPYKVSFTEPYPSQHQFAIPLEDLAVGCGDTLNVAFHAALVKLDEYGEVIDEETGWGEGNPIGKNWAMGFEYTICCNDDEGCTLTQGYWKTHHAGAGVEALDIPWPVSEDTQLCGSTWLDILWTAPAGNGWFILAHQAIATQLNVASGASTTPEVDQALADAWSLLENNCQTLPPAQVSELTTVLDDYNNGLIGPGHCDGGDEGEGDDDGGYDGGGDDGDDCEDDSGDPPTRTPVDPDSASFAY